MKKNIWLASLLLGTLVAASACTEPEQPSGSQSELKPAECKMDSDCLSKGANKICSSKGVCVTREASECNASFTPTCSGTAAVVNCVDGKKVVSSCADGKACMVCSSNSTQSECNVFELVNGQKVNMRTGRAVCVSTATECDPANTSPMCSADGSSVKYCNADGKYEYSACNFGCKAGACKTSECTTLEDSQCADAKTAKVCDNGSWKTVSCDYECVKGECVDAPTCDASFQAKCSDDFTYAITCGADGKQLKTTCSSGQYCNNGACISFSAIQEGMDCNANTAPELCLGTNNLYCSKGKFVSEDCSQYQGYFCDSAIIDGVKTATCVFECTAENLADGDVVAYSNSCEYWDSNGILIYAQCTKGDSGKIVAFDHYVSDPVCLDDSNQMYCASGAKAPKYQTCNGGCVNNVCKEPGGGGGGGGDACDNSYVEHCDGNTGYYCNEGEVSTFSCSNGKDCAVRKSDGYSDCVQACTKGAASTVSCMDYMGAVLAIPMNCEETQSGSYGYFMDTANYNICENGCTEGVGCNGGGGGGGGGECDSSYVEHCDGNTGYYCNKGAVTTFECSDAAPCGVRKSDNYSDCVESCQKGSGTQIQCLSYQGSVLAANYSCDETTAGSYALFMNDYEVCTSGCTDGVGCNGGGGGGGGSDKCDSSYAEHCEGNTGYYCVDGAVDTFECDNNAPCAVRKADGYSDCASACSNGDPNKVICLDYMGAVLAVPMLCQETQTGSYAYFMDTSNYDVCENGCTDGVGCK